MNSDFKSSFLRDIKKISNADILKAIDFSLCDIDIINVENNFNSPEFSKVMEDLGYQKIATLEQDEFYRKKIGKVL